jgi:hypothetical protein
VATDLSADLKLTTIDGETRTFGEWSTTFHLASVVIDPYTNQSAWALPTAARILRDFRDAAVRVNFIVTSDADDAHAFLGPLADEIFVFVDPERSVVKALGLTQLPAFVFVLADGSVRAAAEGWDPLAWRRVAEAIADVSAWSRPAIPERDDPAAFAGSPALG